MISVSRFNMTPSFAGVKKPEQQKTNEQTPDVKEEKKQQESEPVSVVGPNGNWFVCGCDTGVFAKSRFPNGKKEDNN